MQLSRYFPAILAITAMAFTGQASAGAELMPHSAQYKVKISVVSGRLNTELRNTPDGYVAHHVIRPTGWSKMITRGTMDVSSEFTAASDGVLPVRFQAVDTIRDNPDVDLSFDWSTNEASGTVGSEDVVLQLDGVSHDNVSIQYALMHDLLNGGLKEQYVLFDVDKMRIANISSAGDREIKTKAGTFKAVGIRHQKEGSSRITTLWCAEELGFLPVVIEQHRKGKRKFRATLVSYTANQE